MANYNNEEFKSTLIEYLEHLKQGDLGSIVQMCDFELIDTGRFTGIIWNQSSVDLTIRVPITLMTKVESSYSELQSACMDVFPDDNEHALMSVSLKPKLGSGTKTIDEQGKTILTNGGQTYQNLLTKVHKANVDAIEKDYIVEACNCATKGYRLAAATMIGCAAERLLLQLCEAYLKYLKNNNAGEREIDKFEKDVVNAKKAHARLDGFIGKVRNSEELFKDIGLENSNLHFGFLDIVRQVRNESGHPTGIKISEEDLNTIFGNYQLLIDRVHPVIINLPLIKTETEVESN